MADDVSAYAVLGVEPGADWLDRIRLHVELELAPLLAPPPQEEPTNVAD